MQWFTVTFSVFNTILFCVFVLHFNLKNYKYWSCSWFCSCWTTFRPQDNSDVYGAWCIWVASLWLRAIRLWLQWRNKLIQQSISASVLTAKNIQLMIKKHCKLAKIKHTATAFSCMCQEASQTNFWHDSCNALHEWACLLYYFKSCLVLCVLIIESEYFWINIIMIKGDL